MFDRTVRTRVYKCKCGWKGKNPDFQYVSLGQRGRRRICPICESEVKLIEKEQEEVDDVG